MVIIRLIVCVWWSRRRAAHMVGRVGVPSIAQVLLHHQQLVLHRRGQELLLVHGLRLKGVRQQLQVNCLSSRTGSFLSNQIHWCPAPS